MIAARRIVQQHTVTAVRAFASTATGKTVATTTTTAHSNHEGQKQTLYGPMAAMGAALFGAMTAGTMTMLEAKQKLPKQKYTSPAPIVVHGKESHHADYNDPPPRPDLPTYKLEDVAEHCDESSLWFTFRGAVYDMTFFLNGCVNTDRYFGSLYCVLVYADTIFAPFCILPDSHPGGTPVCCAGTVMDYCCLKEEINSPLILFDLLYLTRSFILSLLKLIITKRLLMAGGQDLEPYWEVYRQHLRGHVVSWMERHRIGNLSPEDAKEAASQTFGGT